MTDKDTESGDVTEDVEEAAEDAKEEVEETVEEAKEGVESTVEDAREEVEETVEDAREEVEDTVEEVEDRVTEQREKVEERAEDALDTVDDSIDRLLSEVLDTRSRVAAYVSLRKKDGADAKEVAEDSGLYPEKAENVLDELNDEDVVEKVDGKYHAISPTELVRRVPERVGNWIEDTIRREDDEDEPEDITVK